MKKRNDDTISKKGGHELSELSSREDKKTTTTCSSKIEDLRPQTAIIRRKEEGGKFQHLSEKRACSMRSRGLHNSKLIRPLSLQAGMGGLPDEKKEKRDQHDSILRNSSGPRLSWGTQEKRELQCRGEDEQDLNTAAEKRARHRPVIQKTPPERRSQIRKHQGREGAAGGKPRDFAQQRPAKRARKRKREEAPHRGVPRGGASSWGKD